MKVKKFEDHISIFPKPNYEYRIDLENCKTWDQVCEQIKLVALYSWANVDLITEIADMMWPHDEKEA